MRTVGQWDACLKRSHPWEAVEDFPKRRDGMLCLTHRRAHLAGPYGGRQDARLKPIQGVYSPKHVAVPYKV
jgi:hypothetical protein